MENKIRLKDVHGNDLVFGNAGDIWMPPFSLIQDFRLHVERIRTMDLRDDDVLVMGFPKTGSHWNQQIIYMLLAGSADYVLNFDSKDFLDYFPQEMLNPPDKPRVFFTHLKGQHLPRQIWEKNIKCICLERNPKDTWVSLFHHAANLKAVPGFEGTWAQFFDLMIMMGYWYGDWFDHVMHYEQFKNDNPQLPIMTSSFEKLKKNPVDHIMKINEFLELNRSRKLCEEIAEKCSFTKLKTVNDENTPAQMRNAIWKKGAPGFYRKGEIGDWKNWFTVAQNEQFDKIYQMRMSKSKLTFIYE